VIATARSSARWRRIFLAGGAILAAYALLAPLTSLDAAQSAGVPLLADRLWFRLATIVAMFIVMATAWNIIGGITGYAAFGNVAFFGIGAYTTGMLIAKAKWPFLLALPLAPVVAALFASLVGLPLLRLRGHYFAVASLGVGVAVALVPTLAHGNAVAHDHGPDQGVRLHRPAAALGQLQRPRHPLLVKVGHGPLPGEW